MYFQRKKVKKTSKVTIYLINKKSILFQVKNCTLKKH